MEKSSESRTMLGRVSAEVESTSDLETLAGRLRGTPDGDLSDAVLANAKSFVWALAVVIAGVLFFKWFQENRERDLGDASARFENVQVLFQKMYGEQPPTQNAQDERIKQLRGFEDTLAWLKESHSRTTYAQLADVYGALSELQKGNADIALSKIQNVTPADAETRLDPKGELTRESFLEELALFVKGKALVATQGKDAEAKALLANLVTRAKFVNVEALTLLVESASNDKEKEEAKSLATQLIAARPELKKITTSALVPFGIQLGGLVENEAVIVNEQ